MIEKIAPCPLFSVEPKDSLTFISGVRQHLTLTNLSSRKIMYKIKTDGPIGHFFVSVGDGIIGPRLKKGVLVTYKPFEVHFDSHCHLQIHGAEVPNSLTDLDPDARWNATPPDKILVLQLRLFLPFTGVGGRRSTKIPRLVGLGEQLPFNDVNGAPKVKDCLAVLDPCHLKKGAKNFCFKSVQNNPTQIRESVSIRKRDQERIKWEGSTENSNTEKGIEDKINESQNSRKDVVKLGTDQLLTLGLKVFCNMSLLMIGIFVVGIVLGRAGF